MYLIKTQDALGRLDFDNTPAIQSAVDNSVAHATEELAGVLRTEFDRVTVTDLFYNVQSFREGVAFSTRLRLNRGFLDLGQTYTIRAAATRLKLPLSTAKDLRDEPDGSGDDLTIVDAEKGLVVIRDIDLSNFYIEVGYTAGFALDSDEALLFDQDVVPGWLQEAAFIHTNILVRHHPVLASHFEGDSTTTELVLAKDRAIQTRIRYHPEYLNPVV